MVFGAMTQANGFESGFNLRNIRWTGDYYRVLLSGNRIGGIDINPSGSNIYFSFVYSSGQTASVINILLLNKPYVLSTGSTVLSPSLSTAASLRIGLSFTTDGYLLATRLIPSITILRSANSFGTNFAIPISTLTFTDLSLTAGGSSAIQLAATGPLTSNIFYSTSGATDIYRSLPTIGASQTSFTLPVVDVYSGISSSFCYNKSNNILFSLESLNIGKGELFLNTTYFSNPTVMKPNYQRVNLYPLFPPTMKPTQISSICVDRDKGQYLFLSCVINTLIYIVKFQMRSI